MTSLSTNLLRLLSWLLNPAAAIMSSSTKYINGSMMDGRSIRVDHDWGFVEGRQFGRGRTGGQVSCHMALTVAYLVIAPSLNSVV